MSTLVKRFLFSFGTLRTVYKTREMSSLEGPSNSPKMKFVWIDMEMTGLDIRHDKIMEIACILTDTHLTKSVLGPHLVIHQSDKILNGMGAWCTEQHTKTGLVEECRKSKVTEEEADQMLLDFISQHIPHNEGVLTGNSIFMDKLFTLTFLPKVFDHLHYRVIDVSSLKELCRCWLPKVIDSAPAKGLSHRALDDIKESIEELKHYKSSIFDAFIKSQLQ